MMKLYNNNVRLAKKIAIGTFIAGILFLLGFYLTYDYSLVFGGIFFGLGVFFIVVTILCSDLITAKRQHFNSNEKKITILWNICSLISILFFTIIGLTLVNSSKIIIKNNTNEPIKNIIISGCQILKIDEIPASSSKTIQLFYSQNQENNCSIDINYTTSNSIENDLIIFETTPYKGEKITYEIN